jgi:DNA transformation protein
MPVSDGFVAFVLEQLEPIGRITPKRMFGGVGLYAADIFFALLAGDVLYMRTDDTGRDALVAAGAVPFEPYPGQGKGRMQYYSVPAAILEDGDALIAWATQSIAIGCAGRESPPRRRIPRQAPPPPPPASRGSKPRPRKRRRSGS